MTEFGVIEMQGAFVWQIAKPVAVAQAPTAANPNGRIGCGGGEQSGKTLLGEGSDQGALCLRNAGARKEIAGERDPQGGGGINTGSK